jgi:hypothetical protein
MLVTVAPVALLLMFQGSAHRWFSVFMLLKKLSANDFFSLEVQNT